MSRQEKKHPTVLTVCPPKSSIYCPQWRKTISREASSVITLLLVGGHTTQPPDPADKTDCRDPQMCITAKLELAHTVYYILPSAAVAGWFVCFIA